MEKQYSPSAKDKKISVKENVKQPAPIEKPKQEEKTSEENKKVQEVKKEEKKKIEKKNKAIVYGHSARISTKSSVAVCKMILKRTPEKAIQMLEGVIAKKMPVRMSYTETAHQKSRGMKNVSGAKFPKKVAEEMIVLVRQLKANSDVNGLEEPIIFIAMANKAARPFRSGGRKGKRTHIYLEARERNKSGDNKK